MLTIEQMNQMITKLSEMAERDNRRIEWYRAQAIRFRDMSKRRCGNCRKWSVDNWERGINCCHYWSEHFPEESYELMTPPDAVCPRWEAK